MSLSAQEIREILAVLEESSWDEARLTIGDVTLAVSTGDGASSPLLGGTPTPPPPALPATPDPAPPVAPPAPSPGPSAAKPSGPDSVEPSGHVVTAPSVGIFWRSPEPGAPPFAEVGDTVAAGQTVCIVEVMKLMQHVTCEVAGTVTAIHVENSEHVEFGTPLFSVDPAGA